jgi:error-prone DNA polymerase
MFVHLHTRSWYSFRAGGSSPEALVAEAARLGMGTMGITDRHGVYGVVRFQQACKEHGLRHVFGAEVPLCWTPSGTKQGPVGDLVLLAKDRKGYANLCQLLTDAHLTAGEREDRDNPWTTLEKLSEHSEGLICLTGTDEGLLYPLIDEGMSTLASQFTGALKDIFDERLFVELSHQRRQGDDRRLDRLIRHAAQAGLPTVATGDVRYAVPRDYWRYDLLTCIRHGITVFDDHPHRPSNAMAHVQPEAELARRGLPHDALHRSGEIASACEVDLIPGHIIPPGARLPDGITSPELFRTKVEAGFARKYPPGAKHREAARARLDKEIDIIMHLDIQDFFLVVAEVIEEAQRRGIRCLGRGSAANSIVTFLLDITRVCPIEHNLLFERFLHRGRKGTPDIDLDFDSSRRMEIIAWMEERFGAEHTGMAATIDRYLTKSAVQDTAKALGWPAEMAVQMSKRCSHAPPTDEYNSAHIESVAGGKTPLLRILLSASTALMEVPRHLGQHSGGMVLTRDPMPYFSPLQQSANGVRVVQFDKNDLEWLGLVKLDVLGLRMLGAVSEATQLVADRQNEVIDLDALPFDDPKVYDRICEGDVLGLFQIESPAQMSAGSRIQARSMQDLIKQISLVRPGPILGGLMHPFIRRHQGIETVRYEHPILEDILHDTYGVIVFQEQVLEVAHRFAGWSLDRADQFRRLMSRFRDSTEMEGMREGFVESALQVQTDPPISRTVANRVFDQVSKFVGYGFCRSHAASFALTVYHSAYLKAYYPAAFMAAVMQHRPGMYAQMTLEQEARRHGVRVLVPDVNISGLRFDLENVQYAWAIRKPLTAVKGVSESLARDIILERQLGAFTSFEDFFHRVPADEKELRSLAKAGAFDQLEGANRTVLYKMQVLLRRRATGAELDFEAQKMAHTLLDVRSLSEKDIPALPGITLRTRLEWDLRTHSGPRVHPMIVLRQHLADWEIRPIETAREFGTSIPWNERRPPTFTAAGLVMFRQRPGTAKGTMFIFLEDESGYIQCICKPDIREKLGEVLHESALIVKGTLQAVGPWRGIMVEEAWALGGVIGGYKGRPGGHSFGRDEREATFERPATGRTQHA